MLDKLQNKPWLLFILLAFALRFTSFFPYVIDHDESTYIIIAQQWLQGKIPYVDNIDVKPIGIYIVFAFLLKIVQSVWVIRIGAAIAIGLTANYLNRGALQYFGRSSGCGVGYLYVFLASLHKWSWSANTEIFFLLFSAAGLYHFIKAKKTKEYLLVGLLFGIGFIFKYHILFELIAFLFVFILMVKVNIWTKIKRSLLLFIGLIIPVMSVLMVYAGMGFFQEIWEATYHIPTRYSSTFNLWKALSFMGEFYLSLLPFSLLFFIGLVFAAKKRKITMLIFACSWLIFGWAGILSTGKNYFHYYFQALPSLCFFIPTLLDNLASARIDTFTHFLSRHTALVILLACLTTNLNQYFQLTKSAPYLNEVIDLIDNDLGPEDLVYTNHQNILYFLLDRDVPTRYTHTSLIYKSDLAQAFGIDPVKEIHSIVSQKPKYYLFRGTVPVGFQNDVNEHCSIIRTFNSNLHLYKRRGS